MSDDLDAAFNNELREHDAAYWASFTPDQTGINGTNGTNPEAGHDDDLRAMLVDWDEFWAHDHSDAEWIAEPLIPAKRSVALYAPGGTGKSLLALWLATNISTGCPIFGHHITPRRVLYLDYEMTEDDLAERLEAMGHGADTDLTNLHYALLPSLPGLDEPEGGKAIVRLAQLCNAELVVIDTFARAVHGKENDADTVRAWYRWAGIHLKHEGRAFIRVDHAGKDLEKGQRGTSAKGDDVDVVWQMTRGDGGTYTLKARKRRMGWVPEKVDLVMRDDDPMSFALLHGEAWPAGTAETIELLDQLGVDAGLSVRKVMTALRDAGQGRRQDVIRAAQKHRREDPTTSPERVTKSVSQNLGTHPPEKITDTPSDTPSQKPLNLHLNTVSGDFGTHPDTRVDASGTAGVPINRDTPCPSVTEPAPQLDPEEMF
jgi:hypothetical protein